MKINIVTGLIEELTDKEASELFKIVSDLVLDGIVPYHPLVDEWMETCGFENSNKRLLVISTVFPQKVLLSLLRFYKKLDKEN